MTICGWTEERILLLRKLWGEGLSASQIAKQLGGVTRNAVIGKVHRLGLAGRSTPSRPARRPVRVARAARIIGPSPPRVIQAIKVEATRPVVLPVPDLDPLVFEDGRVATTLTLSESMCKFPIGDPTDGSFAFCGRGACVGPYCGDHARLCYQPASAKKKNVARLGNHERELRRLLREAA